MLLALAFGLAFGFIGSMPLAGPIAVLVFSRGLEQRFRAALHIAIGAALAESAYAFAAYWGVGALLTQYPGLMLASRILGVAILFSLGVLFLSKGTERREADRKDDTAHSNLALGFTITALNPTFLATWTAAAAALHSSGWVPMTRDAAFPFSGGVAIGIVAWFQLMLGLMRRHHSRFSAKTVDRALRAVGAGLVVMAIWVGVRLYLST